MTVQWGKVYVFISSTFNDMHAERDYLVKQVFPQLAEWCEKRKLRLIDIDLRWGVTEQDATENKRVVQVCLERIDACRPFFLCFLGQRRGWVPSKDDISPETFALYPELNRYAGDASVTELEILHALVNPLHHGKVPSSSGGYEEYKPSEHSFFYLRQPDYLSSIPPEPAQLRQVYTNESITDIEARTTADQELERWRSSEVIQTGRPVHNYTASWDPQEKTPEIRIPLSCPSTANPGSHAWKLAFDQWKNRWASVGVQVDQQGEINDPTQKKKAEVYNFQLEKGRLTMFTCEGGSLAETILADLKVAIQARFPNHNEIIDVSPLQKELDQQAQFMQVACEGFIERQGDFTDLDAYVQGENNKTFVLTAPGGLGKTSLLAYWIDRTQIRLASGDSLHYRFIGASDGSTTVDALLRSLLVEIKEITGKIKGRIPPDPEKLRAALPQLLENIGQQGRTVIILDGLNQLETSLGDLSWLPLELPAGLKLIISFKRGEAQAEALYEQLRSGGQVILAEVKPFKELEDRRKLVRAFLSQYLKELDERHVEALIQSEGASNPLYLKVVLAELRVFGAFADLREKIRVDFGTTPISAFEGLLKRLENDPAYSPVQPEFLVPRIFSWLAHARTGLTVEELGELLLRDKLLPNEANNSRLAGDAVFGLLRQVRPYLARRENQFGFFYESFQLAVIERYGKGKEPAGSSAEARTSQAWYFSLATYFDEKPLRIGIKGIPNQRKLAELVFQLAHAGSADRLCHTLWDYAYIKAKTQGSKIDALIADYDLTNLAEAGVDLEARHRLLLLQQTLRLCSHIVYGDIQMLPSQLVGRLINISNRENLHEFLDTIRQDTTGPWLRPLSTYLNGPGVGLLRTLISNTKRVNSVAVSADGELAISGDCNGTIIVWDLVSGRQLRRMTGHSGAVNSVALTASGKLAVSASTDHTLKVWDVSGGTEIRTLRGHIEGVTAVAMTLDGRIAISASDDRTLMVWDISSGVPIKTLNGHTQHVSAVALTLDGRVAISGSYDTTLRVWNLTTGTCLHVLRDHKALVKAIAISPDGRMAISASGEWPAHVLQLFSSPNDTDLRVWDLEEGKLIHRMDTSDYIEAVKFLCDGKTFVSASKDGKIEVRNAIELWHQQPLSEDCIGATSLALTPDDRLLISGGEGFSIKTWDMTTEFRDYSLSIFEKGPVLNLATTLDGETAISSSIDSTVRMFYIKSGGEGKDFELPAINKVEANLVTPNGQVAISRVGSVLIVWKADGTPDYMEFFKLAGHTNHINDAVLTPNGQLVISASEDKTLKIWDLYSGTETRTLAGHQSGVKRVALNPAGNLAVSASDDQLIVWDVGSGTPVNVLSQACAPTNALAFTSDGKTIISIHKDGMNVWDLENCKEVASMTSDEGWGNSFSLTPDGRELVSAGHDRKIQVWDVATAKLLRTIKGHTGLVNTVAVTPDGQYVVSTAQDETIKVWDLENCHCLATFSSDRNRQWILCLTPDGQYIVTGDNKGKRGSLKIEGLPQGPAVVTAWTGSAGQHHKEVLHPVHPAFGCPMCHQWAEIPENSLGTEILCPNCRKNIKLNPFSIHADWQPVAEAWKSDFPYPPYLEEKDLEYYEPPPL